jgi:phosphotransferase system IIA component
MKRVTKIQTLDGQLFDDEIRAKRHAELCYGQALTTLAHKVVAIEKYSLMASFIDENLDEFAKLRLLKADMQVEQGDLNESD